MTTHTTYHLLLKRCQQGDPAAQRQLYDMFAKPMYNICVRMLNDYNTAKDVLQEAFILVFTRLPSINDPQTLPKWVKQIVVNTCINTLKKKRIMFSDEDKIPDLVDEAEINEAKFEGDIQQIYQAIQQLPDGYRIVFTMYLLEDYSHKEIGNLLNISEATSRSQYHKAKQKIIQLIKN